MNNKRYQRPITPVHPSGQFHIFNRHLLKIRRQLEAIDIRVPRRPIAEDEIAQIRRLLVLIENFMIHNSSVMLLRPPINLHLRDIPPYWSRNYRP